MIPVAVSALISTIANGTVPTVAALQAIDATTVPAGATVWVNGNTVAGDGGAGSFSYSTSVVPGAVVANIGSWVRLEGYSGVATPPPSTSYSGYQENFLVLSGVAPGYTISYTFPPAVTMVGNPITIKSITTGLVTFTATGGDQIFDTSLVSSFTSSLVTGQSFHFNAVPGRYYRTDIRSL